jgi:hypothetical protein
MSDIDEPVEGEWPDPAEEPDDEPSHPEQIPDDDDT